MSVWDSFDPVSCMSGLVLTKVSRVRAFMHRSFREFYQSPPPFPVSDPLEEEWRSFVC